MGPTIRNEAPDRAATTTPAAASGELRTASIGRRRGPLGVSGGGDLVNASGMSAAQHSSARMLYDTELTGVSTLIINCEASDPPPYQRPDKRPWSAPRVWLVTLACNQASISV
jgi:hypothetical protein